MAHPVHDGKMYGIPVLTDSIEKYCKDRGKSVSDYRCVAVDSEPVEERISRIALEGSEVIVGYNPNGTFRIGTALIPTKK